MPRRRELRQAVISGSLPVDAAFINAELVPDLFALHLSAYKALVASLAGALKARSLHAELVFGLSGSKHVSSVWLYGPPRRLGRMLRPPSAKQHTAERAVH